MRSSSRLTVLLLVTVLAACQSTTVGSPSAGSLAESSGSAPSASAQPSEAASVAASPGLVEWTEDQLLLLSGVGSPIRRTCVPAPELPPEAAAGIECRPEGLPTIGFYLYEEADAMRQAYFAQLAEFGVQPNSGQLCTDGSPGEGADTPGLEGFEHRIGCYVDADGIAQVRALLPAVAGARSVYIGVAGTDGSIADLLLVLFGPREAIIGCTFCVTSLWFPGRPD